MLKLEVGKFYKTRNSAKVECVLIRHELGQYPVRVIHGDALRAYAMNGGYINASEEHPWDIVEEWREPAAVTVTLSMYRGGPTGIWVSLAEHPSPIAVKQITITEGEGL